jgi:hypothetical protein
MIEALISARVQGERGLKKAGDVLLVKPAGAVWALNEKGGVVNWTDENLEAELAAIAATGEPHPVIVHPYAEYEVLNEGEVGQRIVIVNRSRIAVDMEALRANYRSRIRSRSLDVPPLDERDITTRLRLKQTQGGRALPSRPIPPTRNRR